MLKKYLVAGVSVLMLVPSLSVGVLNVKAYAVDNSRDLQVQELKQEDNFDSISISEEISEKDKRFMNKLEMIYSEFELDSNNYLVLNISDSKLKKEYDFSIEILIKFMKLCHFKELV